MNCRAGAAPATNEQGVMCLCNSDIVQFCCPLQWMTFCVGAEKQPLPWLAAFVSLQPEHWEPCVSGVEPLWGMCSHAPAFQPGQLETEPSPLNPPPPLQGKFFSTSHCAFAYWANWEKAMEWCHNSLTLMVNEALMCCITTAPPVYMRLPVIFRPKLFLNGKGVLNWCATHILFFFKTLLYLWCISASQRILSAHCRFMYLIKYVFYKIIKAFYRTFFFRLVCSHITGRLLIPRQIFGQL